MNQFLGTHQNRLDAKGRVSVPASFRTALRSGTDGDGAISVILRPSHKFACIEGWPLAKFEALATQLGKLNPFSDAHEDLAAALYADAFPVESDKEGRIVIPADLVAHAKLSSQVSFLGTGPTFQIWEPEAGEARRAEARGKAKLLDFALPGAAAA